MWCLFCVLSVYVSVLSVHLKPPLNLTEESTSDLESEENVENSLNDLLPPGYLSLLHCTPRPTPSKKVKKLKVTNVSSDLPMSPTSVIPSSAKVPGISPSFSFPNNLQSSTEVIDARFNGTVPYRLIPVDVLLNIL